MKKVVLTACLLLITLSGTALAAPASTTGTTATHVLGVCLVNSLDGKQRKMLAKWIFLAMAAHPSLQQYATVTPTDRAHVNQYIGHLITKLLAKDCDDELRAATAGNPAAVVGAFRMVGVAAMRELMANRAVRQQMRGYTKYLDVAEIKAAAEP